MSDMKSDQTFNEIVNLVSKLNNELKQTKNQAISTNLANEFNETMKMQSLTRELEKEIKRLETHNKEITEHSDYIIKENTEIRALNQELARSTELTNQRKNELIKEVDELREMGKLLDEDLDKVEDTLSDTLKINNELDKKNLLLNNKIVDLENEQKALETLIIDLHNKAYQLNNKNTELINENASLIKSFNKSSIESEDRKVIELQSTIGSLKVQLFESKNEFNRVSKEYECLDWELKEIKHDLDVSKIIEKELRDIITHGTTENKSLIKSNGDLTDNSYKLFNENVELKKAVEEKKVREQNLMSKCNEANDAVFNLKKINDLSNKELCDLKKAIEVLNERNNNQYHTIKKLDREIFGLESAKAYQMDNTKEKATNILCKKSNEVFGNKHIFEQTIEEMAELMVEINKVRRVNEGFDLTKINNLPQIMEEVCDVQMCLNHLKILFNEIDFKNIQVKKFNKFTDHFKRQFSKKQNEDKLNDLINNKKGIES